MPRPPRAPRQLAGADRPFDPDDLDSYLTDAVDDPPWRLEPDEDAALPGEVADIARVSEDFDLDERLLTAPDRPGCYLMRDRRGEVVYVGKAASLRQRLRQYAAGQDERYFVHQLREVLGAVDVIVTATEKEALILENELIKRHQPRFNVRLKDDKRFLHLRLASDQDFPRLQVVRRPQRDGAQYFGPYASASSARQAIALINRHFQLRTCPDAVFRNRTRPCLEYQIHRCLGPCVLPVDPAEYASHVKDVALFLSGRRGELVGRLQGKMHAAAEAEDFERAARYRDHIHALQTSLEQQSVAVTGQSRAVDAIGLYREGAKACVAVLTFREGVLIGSRGHLLRDQEWPDGEVVAGFCQWLYDGGQAVPDELLVPVALDEPGVLADWLSDLRKQRAALIGERVPKAGVEVIHPQRALKARLLQAAADNARQTFEDHARKAVSQAATLAGLQRRLHLRNLPQRIECFDISNISGTDPTGSMSVAWQGALAPREYRTFRVRSLETPNDFAMMHEVLSRRFERVHSHGWPLPDLVVIDGGKGQLKMAEQVLAELGIEGVDLCGLAKARTLDSDDQGPSRSSPERVFLPGIKNPVVMPQHSNEVYLLTQLRDEAHRLAITLHRKRRSQRTVGSRLDRIPGVGPSRRNLLLQTFGSLAGVQQAGQEALAATPGIGPELAQRIVTALGKPRAPDDQLLV